MSINKKARVFLIVKLLLLLSLVLNAFYLITPFVYHNEILIEWGYESDRAYILSGVETIIPPIIGGILTITSFVYVVKMKLNVALVIGMLGMIFILLLHGVYIFFEIEELVNNEYVTYITLGEAFYWFIAYGISIIAANILLMVNLSTVKCARCENLFTKDQIVKCDECNERVCPNCIDPDSSVCKKCKTRYDLKIQLAEQSKPTQQQSQQVVIQQPLSHQAEMKPCVNCGKLIKFTAKFCDECGVTQ